MKNLTAPSLALIAVVALFAGSGGAVAGSMITGKQIKDNTVTSKDIKNGSLQGADLSPKAVKRFAQGVVGFQLIRKEANVAAGQPGHLLAECPTGTKPVSVTGHWASSSQGVQALFSLSEPQKGAVYAVPLPSDDLLRIQLVCATFGS
ncbi:hypothetical protein NODU109028_09080 [Nocardioides dubius]|uniref:DM13 domain-containing protein n=1 Tax=Nocardioides dubius TaxID=317019 RepID=A0ABN1TV34_9ACTN